MTRFWDREQYFRVSGNRWRPAARLNCPRWTAAPALDALTALAVHERDPGRGLPVQRVVGLDPGQPRGSDSTMPYCPIGPPVPRSSAGFWKAGKYLVDPAGP
jgi:hypothetical protein